MQHVWKRVCLSGSCRDHLCNWFQSTQHSLFGTIWFRLVCSRRVILSCYTLILYYSFNILCLSLSLDLVIRYKILEPSSCRGKKQDVVQKGSTNILQNYAVLETSIKFLALFFVVSICVIFVSAILPYTLCLLLLLILSFVSRIL
jgi:hypothetical protein